MKIRAIEKYNNNIICYFEFPKKLDKTAYIALIEFYIQTILFKYIIRLVVCYITFNKFCFRVFILIQIQ